MMLQLQKVQMIDMTASLIAACCLERGALRPRFENLGLPHAHGGHCMALVSTCDQKAKENANDVDEVSCSLWLHSGCSCAKKP